MTGAMTGAVAWEAEGIEALPNFPSWWDLLFTATHLLGLPCSQSGERREDNLTL